MPLVRIVNDPPSQLTAIAYCTVQQLKSREGLTPFHSKETFFDCSESSNALEELLRVISKLIDLYAYCQRSTEREYSQKMTPERNEVKTLALHLAGGSPKGPILHCPTIAYFCSCITCTGLDPYTHSNVVIVRGI